MNTAIHNRLTALCAKPISQCENKELYSALLKLVQQEADMHLQPVTGRKLYYISAEFLIGKLLSNNLINLGIYEDVRACLAENGKSLAEIEEIEAEPSLGNGGLGRLAACFLDSLATLNLPGDGIGLATIAACSASSSKMSCSTKCRIPGFPMIAGRCAPRKPIPYSWQAKPTMQGCTSSP